MIFDLLARKSGTDTHRIVTSADLDRYLRGGTSETGVEVNASSVMAHATAFTCIRILSEMVGLLPAKLMQRDASGDRSEAPTHPLYRVFGVAPNAWQTPPEFFEMLVTHLMLRGNFYALQNRVELPGGKFEVRELLPIAPGACTPRQRPDRSVVYETSFADGTRDFLGPDRVWHVHLFTVDGINGLTPLQAREAFGLAIATERHAARFYSQGASPGGVLETDQVLDDESYDRVRGSWEEQHKGIENAHKIALLEAGLKYHAVGLSATDAQLLESRRFSQTQIAGLYRVPPHMLGDQGGKYASDEWKAREFVQSAILPIVTKVEARARLLLSPADQARYFLKFNLGALLRGDMAARGAFYQRLQQCGALSPNEIRDFEDMNRREGGDIYLTPVNMTTNPNAAGDASNTGKGAGNG